MRNRALLCYTGRHSYVYRVVVMETHLSFGGYCIRWKWSIGPDEAVQANAEYLGFALLVNPRVDYTKAETVQYYFAPGKGYGYRRTSNG